MKLRKVFLRTYVWSMYLLYGSETWKLGLSESRRLAVFQIWCYQMSSFDRVTLTRIGRYTVSVAHVNAETWGTSCAMKVFCIQSWKALLEEQINSRGWTRLPYIQQIMLKKGCGSYVDLKRLVGDRNLWKTTVRQSLDLTLKEEREGGESVIYALKKSYCVHNSSVT